MKYATVCSGIGAPEVAWKDIWGEPEFTSEIEAFPSAVLKYHYPDVPNYGDMTKYKEWPKNDIGLICGGTPCQSFSIAGLRKGMDDPRGNLTLTFLGILAAYNPRWFIWENVPGVFSSVSDNGADFGRFLSAISNIGYSCAYRVLDAQYFGVPQRRRRVFVVGHIGDDWRPPFAVLFEPESLRGYNPQSRKTREGITSDVASCLRSGGEGGIPLSRGENLVYEVGPSGNHKTEISPTLDARCKDGPIRNQVGMIISNRMTAFGEYVNDDIASAIKSRDHKDATDLIVHAVRTAQTKANGIGIAENKSHTLDRAQGQAIAFKVRGGCEGGGKGYLESKDKALILSTGHDMNIFNRSVVRRLTPLECERLQGFPDYYTAIDWRGRAKKEKINNDIIKYIMRSGCSYERALEIYYCPDSPRYKALGNSMAVPVIRWIGKRIQLWEEIFNKQ